MSRRAQLRAVILLALAGIVLMPGCGGKAVQTALPPQSDSIAPPPARGPQNAVAPWKSEWRTAELQTEFARITAGRAVSASAPLHGEVRLSAIPREDSQLYLNWEYSQRGDYDLNGETNLADISVLGAYFGVSNTSVLWPEARRADGDANGALTIADLTSIASALGESVTDFLVESDDPAAAPEGTPAADGWYLISIVPLAAGSASVAAAARVYELELADWQEGAQYRVTAAFRNGTEYQRGASAAVTAASLRGDWWMEHRDAQHTNFAQVTGPSTGHIAWELELPGAGVDGATPVVDFAGNLYSASTLGLASIRPSGEINWISFTGSAVVTTPAIGKGGTIYAGTADGRMIAFAPTSQQLWTYNAASRPQSPAISGDGTIHFGCADGSAHAIYPDGSLKWVWQHEWPLLSSPAIDRAGRPIFLTDAENFLAVLENGSSAEELFGIYESASDVGVLTQAAHGSWGGEVVDVLLYPKSHQGLELVAFDPDYQEHLHFFGDQYPETPNVYSFRTPALGPEGRIFYSASDGLRRSFGLKASSVIGYFPHADSISVDKNGNVYLTYGPSYDPSAVVCISPDGTQLWNAILPEGVSQAVIDSNTLYLAATDYPYQAGGADKVIAIGGALNGQPPAAPQAPTSMPAGIGKVRLGWRPVNGAAAYEIFRDGGETPYAVTPQAQPSDAYEEELGSKTIKWVDEDAEPGKAYVYTMRAVNPAGVSALSDPVSGFSYLEGPQSVSATDGAFANHVALSWDAVANATGYQILRDGPGTVFTVGNTLSYSDYDLTDWDEHTYTVIAINEWTSSLSGSESTDKGSLQRGAGANGAGDWRMVDHDAAATRRSAILGPASEPSLQWETYLNFDRFGEPRPKAVMFGDDGSIVMATNQNSNYLLGNFAFVFHPDGGLRFSVPQFISSYLHSDGSLLGLGVEYTDGYHSQLQAFNSDGTLRFGTKDIVPISPIIESGSLFAGSATPAGGSGLVVSFEPDGSFNWDYDLGFSYPARFGPVSTADGTVYIALRVHPQSNPGGGPDYPHSIVALNPDGSHKWTHTQNGIIQDCAVAPDGTLYIISVASASNPRCVRAISPDGDALWTFDLDFSQWSYGAGPLCLASDGRILFWNSNELMCLNPDGSESWRWPISGLSAESELLLLDAADNALFYIDTGIWGTLGSLSPSGELRWQLVNDAYYVYALGLRDDGTVVVADSTFTDESETRTRVAAFR